MSPFAVALHEPFVQKIQKYFVFFFSLRVIVMKPRHGEWCPKLIACDGALNFLTVRSALIH